MVWSKLALVIIFLALVIALPQCIGYPLQSPAAAPANGPNPSGNASPSPASGPSVTPPAGTPSAAKPQPPPIPQGLGDAFVPVGAKSAADVTVAGPGWTTYGEWESSATVKPGAWKPGETTTIEATLRVLNSHIDALARAGYKADGFVLLVTAERTFDAEGRFRQVNDERMSTLITPTGLAIEGGIQGAATNRFGYGFKTPLDLLVTMPFAQTQSLPDYREAKFNLTAKLPNDLPPGIYRVRLDFGITAKGRNYNLCGEAFARRGFPQGGSRASESHIYAPPIPASGTHASGKAINAALIQPRMPWIILGNYNSNGYQGVVADEDKPFFALSGRNIIPDDVILPLYDDRGNKIAYNLEPAFPTDAIEARSNLPWDFNSGEMSVQITGPDGKTTDLGKFAFTGKRGQGPTTNKTALTQWRPQAYGQYSVKATGWIADIWGNRYAGGGTYHFWIAKRMTLATATFQGQPYPVGGKYGRDIAFAPAVPADVQIDVALYVNSDANDVRTLSFTGKASPSGIFSGAQGNKQLTLDAPGEYHARILATYTDKDGHLWVESLRHAGIVYPDDSSIVARGKKLTIGGKYYDRGDTKFEGWVDTSTDPDTSYLAHLNFPFQSGDVLLIASEGQGANKIEPVITYEFKTNPAPYDGRLQGIGTTNLRLVTSNGLSPHMFPEYMTEWAYYYGSAPRPGFMSRFIVAEDGTRAPYWPTSPNSFGGQINASPNGDVPGDIYRLLGGAVLKKKDDKPAFAGYISSAFILPKDSKNNRVIAPGSEELIGSTGQTARFFLVGLRPGMMYEVGTAFAPAVQIDPILPVNLKFTLLYPDGRVMVAEGQGDKTGSWGNKDRWTLDIPGIYTFNLGGEWNGYAGFMPGLPATGGYMYVVETNRPATAPQLKFNLTPETVFPPDRGITISGTSTGESVSFAAVIPGAVVDEGTLTVKDGKFSYVFDPAAIHARAPTYDITYVKTGAPDIKDVVHLTFFSKEKAADGTYWHSFVRLIIRGNRVLYTR